MKGCAYTVETDIAANSTGKARHSPGLRPEHLAVRHTDGMMVSVREAKMATNKTEVGGAQTAADAVERIPCPYVYAKGRKCKGHIVRVAAFKADLEWTRASDGRWKFNVGNPRSHYHLYCSEKNSHAGIRREDALKFYYSNLPPDLRAIIDAPIRSIMPGPSTSSMT
jgi:hypothetical protein